MREIWRCKTKISLSRARRSWPQPATRTPRRRPRLALRSQPPHSPNRTTHGGHSACKPPMQQRQKTPYTITDRPTNNVWCRLQVTGYAALALCLGGRRAVFMRPESSRCTLRETHATVHPYAPLQYRYVATHARAGPHVSAAARPAGVDGARAHCMCRTTLAAACGHKPASDLARRVSCHRALPRGRDLSARGAT